MIGSPPTGENQNFQITLSTLGRLKEVEQFENIILKTGTRRPGGAGQGHRPRRAGGEEPGRQRGVRRQGDRLSGDLPIARRQRAGDLRSRAGQDGRAGEGVSRGGELGNRLRQTPYTRESIHEVFNALRDAIILVAIVVLVFLQNWRSSIIPLVAVPVAIIGTFAAMAVFGFSLNNLTLFGLVLAIGIVVDDAIVVVEAVEHHIEHGLSPREATIKAMEQVSGPVIAVGLVLSAVFVPCAFISGITGQFFRQFALTISVSTIISAFNSLTLSPALTALLLKPMSKEHKHSSSVLPWPAFAPGRRLAGLGMGRSRTGERAAEHAAHAGDRLAAASGSPWPAAALVGGVALAWPMNWLLGHAFPAVQPRPSTYDRDRLHLAGRQDAARAAWWCWWFMAAVVSDVSEIRDHAQGFHSVAGHGLSVRQRAIARRGLDGTDRRGDAAAGSDGRQAMPGVLHATDVVGQSFVLNAIGSNFGTMFINLQPY